MPEYTPQIDLSAARFGVAYELVNRRFGIPASSATRYVTAGTTISQLFKNNPDRLAYLLCNTSESTVYVSYLPEVTSTKGIILSPLGGNMMLNINDDFLLVTQPLFAYCATDAQTLTFVEVVAGGGAL